MTEGTWGIRRWFGEESSVLLKRSWFGMSRILVALAMALMLPGGAVAASNFKVLHSFTRNADGKFPQATLVFDGAGNLYGTTYFGGEFRTNCDHLGCGVVFRLAPNSGGNWTERMLHVFNGHPAANAYGGLVFDKAGNLYGTTGNCAGGCGGVVFEVTP
jgi:hypothetical protein